MKYGTEHGVQLQRLLLVNKQDFNGKAFPLVHGNILDKNLYRG